MPTTVEELGPCRKRLRVEVPAERVDAVRKEVLQQIRRHAQIPGFRAGHAPEAMVIKRYASVITEEVQRKLFPDEYARALKETALKPVGLPKLDAPPYQPGQPWVFTAEVETEPVFELGEYKGIPVKKKVATVQEQEVESMLQGLREQQAEFVPITNRALAMEDFVRVNYTGTAEGSALMNLPADLRRFAEGNNVWLRMAADEFVPGFCEQLVGAMCGEKRQVQVDFPANFPPPLSGKKATYFVEVVEIRERRLPALDDAFAKQQGAENLAQLRERVREALQQSLAREIENDMRQQIVTNLLDRITFDLPESLVAQETREIVYDVVRENTLRGATKEQLEAQKDKIFGYAFKNAQDRVRLTFILDAIAERENITVTPEELDQRVAELARRERVAPQRLRMELEKQGRLAEIEDHLRVRKTLDFLLANATVETTTN
ncbi:MAG: trigger factor [Verrucomicrobiae bacterium]|nr:trigger factor [Verrucomicrobiae bacterium]